MTERQEQQIRELRSRGKGYKSIANATGLSRDAVRYFCKRNGLVAADFKAGESCPNCGKPLTQPRTGRRKRFCCEGCRRAWWKKHSAAGLRGSDALYRLTCAHCSKPFDSYGNSHRLYCSRRCYFAERFHGK